MTSRPASGCGPGMGFKRGGLGADCCTCMSRRPTRCVTAWPPRPPWSPGRAARDGRTRADRPGRAVRGGQARVACAEAGIATISVPISRWRVTTAGRMLNSQAPPRLRSEDAARVTLLASGRRGWAFAVPAGQAAHIRRAHAGPLITPALVAEHPEGLIILLGPGSDVGGRSPPGGPTSPRPPWPGGGARRGGRRDHRPPHPGEHPPRHRMLRLARGRGHRRAQQRGPLPRPARCCRGPGARRGRQLAR